MSAAATEKQEYERLVRRFKEDPRVENPWALAHAIQEKRRREMYPTPDETTEIAFMMAAAIEDPRRRPAADRAIAHYRKKYPGALSREAERRLWRATRARLGV